MKRLTNGGCGVPGFNEVVAFCHVSMSAVADGGRSRPIATMAAVT